MALRDRLLELRKRAGRTQVETAAFLGLSRSAYSLYELGTREPSNDMLLSIAHAYGVSTDYLLGHTDDPKPSTASPSPPNGIRLSRDYPLPPKGYEDLSPEEREEVDRITREFEDFHIQRILERKRREKEER